MIKKACLVFCLLYSLNGFSQILNIDRAVEADSGYKKWSTVIDFDFTSEKIKKSLLDIDSKIQINRFFKTQYVIVGSLSNGFTLNGKEVLQNDGYAEIRYRDNDKRKWSNESFAQLQWNGALGMISRKVTGCNLRAMVFDKQTKDLYYGVGFFYENEQWNWAGVENKDAAIGDAIVQRSLVRLNQYWKFANKVNDNLDISLVSYLQFPLNSHFFSARWFIDVNANVKITNKISFAIHWDHTYDDYRLVPIKTYYYSMKAGIQLKW